MTDDALRELLDSDDDFRVAIRGFTAIEQLIDSAIEEALPGRWEGKVRTFGGFRQRLELAVALALVPPDWAPAVRELASLRNDFAHGKIERVTRARVRRVAKPVEPIVENFKRLSVAWEANEPVVVLRDVIFAVHWAVRASIEVSTDVRYQRYVAEMVAGDLPAKIMDEWRSQGRPGAPS